MTMPCPHRGQHEGVDQTSRATLGVPRTAHGGGRWRQRLCLHSLMSYLSVFFVNILVKRHQAFFPSQTLWKALYRDKRGHWESRNRPGRGSIVLCVCSILCLERVRCKNSSTQSSICSFSKRIPSFSSVRALGVMPGGRQRRNL